jgi:micrococcal nuclease
MVTRLNIVVMLCCLAGPVGAQEEVTNPYALYYAEVVRVIDGDTLDVRVDLWPGLQAVYAVRVRGIDAPELRRVGCEEERIWAQEAKAQVEKLYDVGSRIRLENVAFDAYSGRVDADVRRWRSDRWIYLADELVERNLAVAWTPDMADVPWCLLAKTR